MKKIYFLLAALMMAVSLNATTVDDVLTIDVFGITKKTTYTNVTGVSATSEAVYSANVARSTADALQLRAKNDNSGVVTTATGGKLSKIAVVWNSASKSGNKVDVYGSNTAYSAPTDLYDTAKQGAKIGTIEYGVTTELAVTGDYTFVAFRASNSAIYLDSVTVTWETDGAAETVASPTFSLESGKYNGTQSLEVTAVTGAQLFVKVNADEYGDAVASPYTVALEAESEMTKTYTVEAYAQVGDQVSKTAKATYIIIPESTRKYGRFDLATSIAQLTNGCRVVITSNDNSCAMSKTWAYGQSCTATDIVVSDNKIEGISNDVAVYNVTFDGTNYSFYNPFAVDTNGTSVAGYICAVSSDKNYLGTQATLDNEGRFSVTIAENGDATAVSQGDFTHNTMRYNYGAFRAYGANTTISTLVRFYVEDPSTSSVKAIAADDAAVRTIAGGIEVDGRGALTVVNAAGQVVAAQTIDGRASLSLPRGFYIVRLASTTAKVIVK